MSYRGDTWRWEMHVARLKGAPSYHLGFLTLMQPLIVGYPQDIACSGDGYGTPLNPASWRHIKVFKLLLSHSISVDVRDSDGRTPLHLAASDGLLGYAYRAQCGYQRPGQRWLDTAAPNIDGCVRYYE